MLSFYALSVIYTTGSQREESRLWNGHEEGSLTKHKGVIWLQGFPLSFPEHLPPKTRVCLLYYCAFHSSDILLKEVNSGLQSLASAQAPLMAL